MRPIRVDLPIGRSHFIPAGCLHWPIGEKPLLKKWIQEVKEAENGFTVLLGDSLDTARTHYRKHIRAYGEDENSQLALDEWHKNDVKELADLLTPIKSRIKGIILGNHYWTYSSGVNSEQYLADLLGIPYLGPVGLIRLDFRDKSGRTRQQATVYCHHSGGSKGGRTTSGDVGALERSELSFDADIYALSHTHRRYATRQSTMSLTPRGEPRVEERTKLFLRTGAFLKGYKEEGTISLERPHFPSYAEGGALRPTDLGWIKVTIDVTARRVEGSDSGIYGIDYKVEY